MKKETLGPITNYAGLWRELAEAHAKQRNREQGSDPHRDEDAWRDKARTYYEHVQRRWVQPDSSRTFVVNWLDAHPGSTAIDIGAGPGAWTVLMAQHARSVTAVEPSASMLQVLRENTAAAGLKNVTVVHAPWPEAQVGSMHDASLCFHAMYAAPDLPAFISRMVSVTRRTCFLGLRVPAHNGLMAEAARRIWGQCYDSTNFQVAYNVLLEMGICANVLMEDSGLWTPWTSPSLEDALKDVKRRFGLPEHSQHDDWLRSLLKERLVLDGGQYVWPRAVRSALVYWDVERM